MGIHFQFDTRPMRTGETREFVLQSPSPVRVEIRCFVRKPPPPGYKPCEACGSFIAQSGESVFIEADRQMFAASGGMLEIHVAETHVAKFNMLGAQIDEVIGDSEVVHIEVLKEDYSAPQSFENSPVAGA